MVHLHGGRTPPEHDGYPIDFVLPVDREVPLPFHATESGDSVKANGFTGTPSSNRPRCSGITTTAWISPVRGVWEGLADFHIIRDDEEDALGLPSGPRELPLMIVDRSFDLDGSLLYPAIDPTGLVDAGVTVGFEAGVLGDVTLVNGVPWPSSTSTAPLPAPVPQRLQRQALRHTPRPTAARWVRPNRHRRRPTRPTAASRPH